MWENRRVRWENRRETLVSMKVMLESKPVRTAAETKGCTTEKRDSYRCK